MEKLREIQVMLRRQLDVVDAMARNMPAQHLAELLSAVTEQSFEIASTPLNTNDQILIASTVALLKTSMFLTEQTRVLIITRSSTT